MRLMRSALRERLRCLRRSLGLGLSQVLVAMSKCALSAIFAGSHFKVLALSSLEVLTSSITAAVIVVITRLIAVRLLNVATLEVSTSSASLMLAASSGTLIVVIALLITTSCIVLMVMMKTATSSSTLSMMRLLLQTLIVLLNNSGFCIGIGRYGVSDFSQFMLSVCE